MTTLRCGPLHALLSRAAARSSTLCLTRRGRACPPLVLHAFCGERCVAGAGRCCWSLVPSSAGCPPVTAPCPGAQPRRPLRRPPPPPPQRQAPSPLPPRRQQRRQQQRAPPLPLRPPRLRRPRRATPAGGSPPRPPQRRAHARPRRSAPRRGNTTPQPGTLRPAVVMMSVQQREQGRFVARLFFSCTRTWGRQGGPQWGRAHCFLPPLTFALWRALPLTTAWPRTATMAAALRK